MSHTPAVYLGSKYIGFLVEGNRVFLQRCPKCDKENWAMSVAKGECAWCGYDTKNMKNFAQIKDKPEAEQVSCDKTAK